MTSREAWKQLERRISKIFNTDRTPLSGSRSRHTKSDTLHKKLFIEIKFRKRIPFMKIFRETLTGAKEEKKIPMMVVHEKNHSDDICFIRLSDLRKVAKVINE